MVEIKHGILYRDACRTTQRGINPTSVNGGGNAPGHIPTDEMWEAGREYI